MSHVQRFFYLYIKKNVFTNIKKAKLSYCKTLENDGMSLDEEDVLDMLLQDAQVDDDNDPAFEIDEA